MCDGESTYFRRHRRWCKAFPIPFGALVDFRPPKPLLKKLPKMGPTGIPGIMLGYHVQPGGKWSGDYLVSPLCDWDTTKTTGRNVRCFRIKEIVFSEENV